MKKMNLKVVTCLVAGSLMFSSCFVGSYGLFNSYANNFLLFFILFYIGLEKEGTGNKVLRA